MDAEALKDLKNSILAMGMSEDELDDFVLSLYDQNPGFKVEEESEWSGPDGWDDWIAEQAAQLNKKRESSDFDPDAFDDEISTAISDAWSKNDKAGAPENDADFDNWSERSGLNKFVKKSLDGIYGAEAKADGDTEAKADVNADGDTDVKIEDIDNDGKADTATVKADSPKEAAKASEVADKTVSKDKEDDTDSTGDWGGVITDALLNHRL